MSPFVGLQKILPKKLLTELAGLLAEVRWRPFKNLVIRIFCRHYQVDLSQAQIKDVPEFASFNDFFTRALEQGARPIDTAEHSLASPADGAVSALGNLQQHSLIQAKDILYSASELLADDSWDKELESGSFITIYLSPRDYHRVHVPLAGELLGVTYVPGRLFSVNDVTARTLDGLFSRNERIVAKFQTLEFSYALVMVGAMIVGGIETVVNGRIRRQKQIQKLNENVGRSFLKGEEFGRFHLGSTAILIFPKMAGVKFMDKMAEGSTVKMGQAFAELVPERRD